MSTQIHHRTSADSQSAVTYLAHTNQRSREPALQRTSPARLCNSAPNAASPCAHFDAPPRACYPHPKMDAPEQSLATTVCIIGGGPAGIMLGFLLARAGIRVTVLEKYKDFFRDFRGDTIHPSTLEILYELSLLEKFLTLP